MLCTLFILLTPLAYAQSCSQAVNTINSPSDALTLSQCSTLTGDLQVGLNFSGILSIAGVQEIKGSFQVEGASNITSIVAKDLNTINGSLILHELKAVTSLSFPVLSQVLNISLVNMPELVETQFPVNISIQAVVADNVGLEQVELFGAPGAPQFTFAVLNNAKQTELAFSHVTAIQTLLIAGNNPKMTLSMDSLNTVNDMNIWNILDLSMQNLTTIQGSLELVNNNFPDNVSLPSLTSVHNSLTIVSHPNMSTIFLPLLGSVGGSLQIAGNPNLRAISLPNLSNVGDLDISGNISSITLPSLATVKNYVNVQSALDLDCTNIQALQAAGSITCKGNVASPQPFIPINETVAFPVDPDAPSSTTPSSTTTMAATSPAQNTSPAPKIHGLSGGVKAGIAIAAVVGICLTAATVYMVLRSKAVAQRRRSHESLIELSSAQEHLREHHRYERRDEKAPFQLSQVQYRLPVYEVPESTRTYEMDGGGKERSLARLS